MVCHLQEDSCFLVPAMVLKDKQVSTELGRAMGLQRRRLPRRTSPRQLIGLMLFTLGFK